MPADASDIFSSSRSKPKKPKSLPTNNKSSSMKYSTRRSSYISSNQFLQRSVFPVYYDLNKRVKFYDFVRKKLSALHKKGCLVPTMIHKKNGQLLSNGYLLHDVIYLHKQIGSQSKAGIIFKAFIKSVLGGEPVAAKLMRMTTHNNRELDISTIVSSVLLQKKVSPHFLFSYKSFYCKHPQTHTATGLKDKTMTLQHISHSNYFVLFNELAHGDLKALLQNKDILADNNILCNLLCQCFLAVATFHRLGFLHNDCHNKNFLYFRTEDTDGYFHYKINQKDFYLKNYGYNIMLYDFGMAEEYTKGVMDMNPNYYLSDYTRICSAFMNKKYKGWSEYDNLPNNQFSHFVKELKKYLLKNQTNYRNEDEIIEEIAISCRFFLLDALPTGGTVLNKKAYHIDESIRFIRD